MPETRYEVPPKLPVPRQTDSFKSYLDDLSAIVPTEDWARARDLVDQFTAKTGLGPQLHKKLEEHAQTVDNWVRKVQKSLMPSDKLEGFRGD
jgi:Choline/Carnitine o-acyltransferase